MSRNARERGRPARFEEWVLVIAVLIAGRSRLEAGAPGVSLPLCVISCARGAELPACADGCAMLLVAVVRSGGVFGTVDVFVGTNSDAMLLATVGCSETMFGALSVSGGAIACATLLPGWTEGEAVPVAGDGSETLFASSTPGNFNVEAFLACSPLRALPAAFSIVI